MNEIIELIKDYKSISIIGMDKNSGKTTTLNHILNETRGKFPLGLTSIGRDGEDLDRVTATHKPKIYIEKGTLVATAKQALFNSDITREILETTGINTPMGEVIIVRALSDGYIDLAGPSVSSYIKDICNKLLELGCEKVLVDGALSRKSFASPSVTEATILAAGASLSKSMNKVVEQTVHTIDTLTLESINDKRLQDIYREELKDCRIAIIDKEYKYKKLSSITSLQAGKEIKSNIDENTKFVVVKGVISDSLIEELIKCRDKIQDIIFTAEDGTKLFISNENISRFRKCRGKLKVINNIKIACVTINPSSPYGYEFDKHRFLECLQERINIPVFNVLSMEE